MKTTGNAGYSVGVVNRRGQLVAVCATDLSFQETEDMINSCELQAFAPGFNLTRALLAGPSRGQPQHTPLSCRNSCDPE